MLGLRGYLNDMAQSEQPLLGDSTLKKLSFNALPAEPASSSARSESSICRMIVGLRRGAVNTGAWEDDHGSKLFLALERGSNALGMSSTERDKFMQKTGAAHL